MRRRVKRFVLVFVALFLLAAIVLIYVNQTMDSYDIADAVDMRLEKYRPFHLSPFWETEDLEWAKGMRASAREIHQEVITFSILIFLNNWIVSCLREAI